MYDIHFRRYADSEDDRAVVGQGFASLASASNARVVSGDLVVHAGTNHIVKNIAWLWEREKLDPNCHAQRAIKAA